MYVYLNVGEGDYRVVGVFGERCWKGVGGQSRHGVGRGILVVLM